MKTRKWKAFDEDKKADKVALIKFFKQTDEAILNSLLKLKKPRKATWL
jgi:hypothetical protein